MSAATEGGAGTTLAPRVAQLGLDVHWVPRGELKASEYNPRRMTEKEAGDLLTSLREFGFVEPLVANSYPGRENVVVGGHQRLALAEHVGAELVPVVYVHLELEKERELNLRLNKNTGSWDWDMIANHFDIANLREVGFSDEELAVKLGIDVEPNSAAEAWKGMPEFDQQDKTAFRSIVVHFKDEDAVREFVEKLGVDVSAKARFLWYPRIEIERFADKRYSS